MKPRDALDALLQKVRYHHVRIALLELETRSAAHEADVLARVFCSIKEGSFLAKSIYIAFLSSQNF